MLELDRSITQQCHVWAQWWVVLHALHWVDTLRGRLRASCALMYLGETVGYMSHICLVYLKTCDFELSTWPLKTPGLSFSGDHILWNEVSMGPHLAEQDESRLLSQLMENIPKTCPALPLSPFWTLLLRAQRAWPEYMSIHEGQGAAPGMMDGQLEAASASCLSGAISQAPVSNCSGTILPGLLAFSLSIQPGLELRGQSQVLSHPSLSFSS